MSRAALSRALPWLALVLVVLWAAGRVGTDTHYATQFLFWIPALAVMVAGAALLFASRILAPRSEGRARPGRVGRRWAGLALAGVLAHAVVEARLLAPGPAGPSSGRTLRVVYWNPSWGTVSGLAEEVRRADADVFVVGDQPTDVPWERVRDAMGGTRSALWAMNSVVLSRHRILRWGATSLEIEGVRVQHRVNPDGTERWTRQRGRAIWLEVDTGESLGRPMVLWTIDMPSDPLLDRGYAGRQAARAVREWSGPAFERAPDGRDVPDSALHRGFPAPDLVVGDFNTHRGAGSLADLTTGLASAFEVAGRGMMGTFPRTLPLWHVDQAFAGSGVRVLSYRLRDPGEGRHRMQIIDLERAR